MEGDGRPPEEHDLTCTCIHDSEPAYHRLQYRPHIYPQTGKILDGFSGETIETDAQPEDGLAFVQRRTG